MGFDPQVADMNGDGIDDIISGSYWGDPPAEGREYNGEMYYHPETYKDGKDSMYAVAEIFVYYGNEDGTYQPRQRLAMSHQHAAICVVDFDGDGDFDILGAPRSSYISFQENYGGPKAPYFSKPVRITEGVDFFVEYTNAPGIGHKLAITSVDAVDWDEDGDLDIIAGTDPGHIVYLQNYGEAGKGTYNFLDIDVIHTGLDDSFDYATDSPVGRFTFVHVTDFDGDGVRDLLVGDSRNPDSKIPEDKEAYNRVYQNYLRSRVESSRLGVLVTKKGLPREEAKAEYGKIDAAMKEKYGITMREFFTEYSGGEFSQNGFVWFFKGVKK